MIKVASFSILAGVCVFLAGGLLWISQSASTPAPARMEPSATPVSVSELAGASGADDQAAADTGAEDQPVALTGVDDHPAAPSAGPRDEFAMDPEHFAGPAAPAPAADMRRRVFVPYTARPSQSPAYPAPQADAPAPTPPDPDLPVSLELSRFFHSQRTETKLANACGPASLLIALDYFGLNPGRLDQVIQAMRLPQEKGGFDTHCSLNPVCLSPAVLAQVSAETYGLTIDAHPNWTYEELHQSLASGRPVIVDVTWGLKPGGFGHFVIVYGIDPLKKMVYYHDPYDGPGRSASWKDFSASWNGPVDVGDPLQPAGHTAWGMALGK